MTEELQALEDWVEPLLAKLSRSERRQLTPFGTCGATRPVLASSARSSNRGGESNPLPQPDQKKPRRKAGFSLAGGEGFEPPLAESESAVLPLDDPPSTIFKWPPG